MKIGDNLDINSMKATNKKQKYVSSKWTPCLESCAYCSDPNYGQPLPHPSQKLKSKKSK